MIKRYRTDDFGCTDMNDGVIKEDNSGEYVRYDDILPLLEWLKEKAEEWQSTLGHDDWQLSKQDCGEELESVLKRFVGEIK